MEIKRSYRVLQWVVRHLTPKMTTVWEEPYDGTPCVFCPNHVGMLGPIDMVCHFELCDSSRAWFNNDVADAKKMPAYVRQDYWWKPGCKLEPLYNATIPYLAAAALPPIMRTVPGIPVYHDMQVIKTFRQSISVMKDGENLIIFPQQPSGYKSHHMWINKGFLQIAPMAWRTLHIPLKFYPVYIDHPNHKIYVRKPVRFDPERTLAEQEQELVDALAKGLRSNAEQEEEAHA